MNILTNGAARGADRPSAERTQAVRAVLADIRAGIDPLDAFSFPSGHTLHAVAFTIVAVAYFPARAVLAL